MRLLLIDDHAMFRQGLTFLLTDLDPELRFSEAGSCRQALDVLSRDEIDLILLDLKLPDSDDLKALGLIRDAHPGTPLVVLSGEEDSSLIRRAIDRGASGFIPKASNSELLVAALRVVLAGGIYLPALALSATHSDEQPSPTAAGEPGDLLSDRQREVLLRAIQGQPNKLIAIELGIAEGTVKTHLSAAFKSLGVRNRTEAVFAAARLGIGPDRS